MMSMLSRGGADKEGKGCGGPNPFPSGAHRSRAPYALGALTLPDPAGVVLATSNDRVALVIECTRKYLICVPFQNLQRLSTLHVPKSSSLVGAGRQDLGSLRI